MKKSIILAIATIVLSSNAFAADSLSKGSDQDKMLLGNLSYCSTVLTMQGQVDSADMVAYATDEDVSENPLVVFEQPYKKGRFQAKRAIKSNPKKVIDFCVKMANVAEQQFTNS